MRDGRVNTVHVYHSAEEGQHDFHAWPPAGEPWCRCDARVDQIEDGGYIIIHERA
jgi:hypothetical protein